VTIRESIMPPTIAATMACAHDRPSFERLALADHLARVDITQNDFAMQIDVTDYAHAITNQTQTVAAAKARAVRAAADEVRYRGLVSTGAASASTYDQVKAAADAAKAQLAALEAEEKAARDQGDYSLLVADADGTVVETLAEPGQVVPAGQTVVKLAHAGPREASIYLPETLRPAPAVSEPPPRIKVSPAG